MPQMNSALSLDELLALNDEIAALVRAGVPLESGLFDLGRDLPGRLGRLAERLSERLQRGETLDQAVAAERADFPRLYLAIVEAGQRSGRLAVALEGMTAAARRVAEMRQIAGAAMVYPIVVFLLAWALTVAFVTLFAPAVASSFHDFRAPAADWMSWIAGAGETVVYWGPIGPAVVLLSVGIWWRWSRRAITLDGQRAGRWLGWIPGVRDLLRSCQAATFAEVLALLVEQETPLAEALRLSASASGGPPMIADAQSLAASIERGEPPAQCLSNARRFPPLLGWLIATGQQRGALVPALRHAAASYRQRALRRAEALQVFLPVALTLGIGGTTALAYALLLFTPWINLLKTVSQP
ncbi:MAG TPA: type II secretion system F family protein [Pirellulales bacterium]